MPIWWVEGEAEIDRDRWSKALLRINAAGIEVPDRLENERFYACLSRRGRVLVSVEACRDPASRFDRGFYIICGELKFWRRPLTTWRLMRDVGSILRPLAETP